MYLTIAYWTLIVALVVAILTMTMGLVAFVTTTYESIRRIFKNRGRYESNH